MRLNNLIRCRLRCYRFRRDPRQQMLYDQVDLPSVDEIVNFRVHGRMAKSPE